MNKKSVYVVVGISLIIGFLHFLIGPNYNGFFKEFISGYLIDLLLPMDLYLLLQITLRKNFSITICRIIGVLLPFLFGLTVEILQLYNIRFFGRTYDPLDILMYGIGVITGLLIDLLVINKIENLNNKIE